VVNVIKVSFTLNFLLLGTVAVMEEFWNGYERKDRDNEAGSSKDSDVSSGRETV
jgi:hypothetical protein